MTDHIGMDHKYSARRQDLGNGTLAGTDAPGEDHPTMAPFTHVVTVL